MIWISVQTSIRASYKILKQETSCITREHEEWKKIKENEVLSGATEAIELVYNK